LENLRKLIQIGNTIGITLLAEYLKARHLKLGESMEIHFDEVICAEPLDLAKVRKAVERSGTKKEK